MLKLLKKPNENEHLEEARKKTLYATINFLIPKIKDSIQKEGFQKIKKKLEENFFSSDSRFFAPNRPQKEVTEVKYRDLMRKK